MMFYDLESDSISGKINLEHDKIIVKPMQEILETEHGFRIRPTITNREFQTRNITFIKITIVFL